MGLLAYSPLGQGVLTGKYLDGKKPEGARGTLFDMIGRYQGRDRNRPLPPVSLAPPITASARCSWRSNFVTRARL